MIDGPELMALRRSMGLSRTDVARALGLAHRTIERYESEGAPVGILRGYLSLAIECGEMGVYADGFRHLPDDRRVGVS